MSECFIMRRGGGGKQAFAFLYIDYPTEATSVKGFKKNGGSWDELSPDKTIVIGSSKRSIFYLQGAGIYYAGASKDGTTYKNTDEYTITADDEGESFGMSVSFEYPLSLDISDWTKTLGNMQQREDGAIGYYATTANPRAYLNIPLNISGYTKLNITVETSIANNSTIGLSDGEPTGGKAFAASETFNSGTKQIDLSLLDTSKTYYLMWQLAAQNYAYITSASLS